MNRRTQEVDFLKFAVDAQLLGELGEKLVSKNYVALSELLKNAYDADATDVLVKFVESASGGSERNSAEIQIVDNGSGMTFDEVRSNWMRIATPNKVEKPVSSEFGRPRTGSKGIGRFSCQRIARHLVLTTTAKLGRNQFETTEVQFDWLAFKPGTDLTEVPNKYLVTYATRGEVGTTLRLQDLRERWTERDFTMLQRQVVLLTVQKGARRSSYKEDPGFGVRFEAPEFPRSEGILLDRYMEAGWGLLSGQVDANGRAQLTLNAKLIGKRELVPDEKFEFLPGLEWQIAFIPQDRNYFRDKRLTSGVAETLRVFGGVRLYMDGFRVYPYGDSEDDWLGIDRDVARRKGSVESPVLQKIAASLKLNSARAMLNHPRHRNLIGRIYLSAHGDTPFVVKMDREGLVDNEAYRQLTRFLRFALDWMTLWYGAFLRQFAKERRRAIEREFQQKAKEAESAFDAALNLLVDRATTRGDDSPEATEGLESVHQARELIEARVDEANSELAVLRAVASTGPLMFAFAHEVRGVIGLLDSNAGQLEQLAQAPHKARRDDLRQSAKGLRDASFRFSQLTTLFGIFTSAQRLTKKRIPVRAVADEVVKGFGFVLSEFKIRVALDIDEALKSPSMVEAEFYSIVVNLLSNAVKASIAGRSEMIKVAATQNGDFVLRVLDQGVGLSKDRWAEVFEPLNPDPEDRIYRQLSARLGDQELGTLGRGTGLGLSIVRGIAEDHGGHAEFTQAPRGWKTCIEVHLP